MEKAELLADFKANVDLFEKYHGFIEKTKQQADKFAKAVVDKVIKDNSAKRDDVAADLVPLAIEIDAVIGDLEQEKETLLEGQQDQKLALEEMELRKAIGELTDKEFEKETKGLQADLKASDELIGGLNGELETFNGEMSRWREVGREAGVLTDSLVMIDEDEDEDEDDVPEIESVDILEPDADIEMGDDVDVAGFRQEGVRFEQVKQVDDVSVVFAEDDGEEAEIKLEVGEMDTLLDEDLEAIEEEGDDRPRRAVMLYQEGTAEEQIHPFTGDVLTLGRGRDNDIQVKNDSKVSRYHCKLYRRNGNFYIEDNKSANGTLVNGELITERRLFGGEEIIIGETFFRFRIMD
ncbi:MAG: FHA domain-containing protein [Deltaproteobacteria bacterium]|nr:FHA domain-containing protein [Deltaproteobacteria bacterium]